MGTVDWGFHSVGDVPARSGLINVCSQAKRWRCHRWPSWISSLHRDWDL